LTSPLLDVRHLTVSYPTAAGTIRAVRDFSLILERGETLALVGESGCGKSTIALSVLGLLPPSQIESGEILFESDDLLSVKESALRQIRGGKIGMIFQDARSSLNPILTAGEHLIESLKAHQELNRRQARMRALELLAQVGIPEPEVQMPRYSFELSGGMCQRIAIALSVCNNPLLLIADEPTSALDPTIQVQVLELLQEMKRRLRLALLLISHDLPLVAEWADRVAVMYHGRLIEAGTTTEVLAQPSHPYTRAVIRALPDLARNRDSAPLSPIPGSPPIPGQELPGCAFAPRCPVAEARCTAGIPSRASLSDSHWAACIKVK
jgi:oligopeptide/dipeptide ABC transporter ATP-binding protein